MRASPGSGRAWVEEQLASGRPWSECWLDWPFGVTGTEGYPKTAGAPTGHLVLELTGRPRPEPPVHYMRHACDRAACVSPGCLAWGTKEQNEADKRERGCRNAGSGHGMAKLTEDDVRRIRSGRVAGRSLADLATAFGVSVPTVSDIVNRKSWRHL